MNTRIIGILLVSIMCITVAVSAAAAQSTPFVINGNVSDSNSNPCNGAWVQVTNTNTTVGWDAENDSESNYYRLVLSSDNVTAGNILQFEASGCSEIKMMEHTVTQSEIGDGGMIGIDIVFDVESMPDLTVTAIGTPARLRADVINPISATVENIGYENATSFNVTLETGGSIVDTATVTSLNAGENTTVEFLWTPSSADVYTLNVTADANGEVIESDEANNNLSETANVLEKLTATVNVRIEGKGDTVWCGDVTFSSSVLTASDSSIHYLNEPTALGALNEANESGGFGYVTEDHPLYGLGFSDINSEPAIGYNGWMYRVDYASPWFGAVDYTLYGGEDVLFYFGAWTAPPLKIELDRTTVMVDEVFVATVTAYNDTTTLFDPVDTAEVYVNGTLYGLTEADGTLTMSLAAGDYQIHADKGTWAEYTRSEKINVTVKSPDLIVTAIETPSRLRNEVINPISAVIENTGTFAAGSFNVTLMVDGVHVDTASVTALESGESTTVEFLWTPDGTGDVTLTVAADANNDVVESNETNNDLSETVDVLPKLTVTANVRIEGKDDTVWCGNVTFSSSVLFATDGSIHYLNEPTALGALDEADKLGGFGYVLDNTVYGLYVPEVAGEQAFDWNGWMYRVNYVMPPWVGAADYTLADNDEALWFFGPYPVAPPLKIELDKTIVMTGEEFVATVKAYNDSTAAFDSIEAAEVYVDGTLYGLTGTDGTLTISLGAPGTYQIHADKGTWADYTRSDKVNFLVDTIEPELILELINEGNVSTLYVDSSEPLSNCTVNDVMCTISSSKNWSKSLNKSGEYIIIATDIAGNEALRNLTLEIGTIKETIDNQTNYTTGNVTLNITTTLDVTESSNITICEYDENPVGTLNATTVSLLGINKFVQIEVDSELNDSIGTVRISINYSGADLSEIDEDSLKLYVWNASIESWEELEPSGIDKVKTIVWGELNHLSLFSILGEEPEDVQDDDDNGGSSGGSSSGGGASGELYENIACSETDRRYVYTNSDISYSFELECNIVQFVKFTSLKSAGQVATKVEILKDTSTLVDNPPSDIVYKNLNIWVGNAGWATERNIDDATVVFTLEKSWITENNIDESSIALYRYSDDTWHELVTKKIAEDADSLQFEAETPGFSPFAVSGKELEGEPGGEGIIAGPTATVDKNPAPTPTEKKGMPGFDLFAGLSVLLIAVQLLRKKK